MAGSRRPRRLAAGALHSRRSRRNGHLPLRQLRQLSHACPLASQHSPLRASCQGVQCHLWAPELAPHPVSLLAGCAWPPMEAPARAAVSQPMQQLRRQHRQQRQQRWRMEQQKRDWGRKRGSSSRDKRALSAWAAALAAPGHTQAPAGTPALDGRMAPPPVRAACAAPASTLRAERSAFNGAWSAAPTGQGQAARSSGAATPPLMRGGGAHGAAAGCMNRLGCRSRRGPSRTCGMSRRNSPSSR